MHSSISGAVPALIGCASAPPWLEKAKSVSNGRRHGVSSWHETVARLGERPNESNTARPASRTQEIAVSYTGGEPPATRRHGGAPMLLPPIAPV